MKVAVLGAFPSSSSFTPAVWSRERVIENIVVAAVEFVVLVTCCAQLFRIGRRSVPRMRFIAKRVFFVLLAVAMLTRDAWCLYFVLTPCYTQDSSVTTFCFVLDNVWQDINSTIFSLCYLATVLFWAEFVHVMSGRSEVVESHFGARIVVPLVIIATVSVAAAVVYSVLVVVWAQSRTQRRTNLEDITVYFFACMYIIIATALAWYGGRIAWYVRHKLPHDSEPSSPRTALLSHPAAPVFQAASPSTRHHSSRRSRQAVKIISVALACSVLLYLRAAWNITDAVRAQGPYAGEDWKAAYDFIYEFCFEIIPAWLMIALMWPLPNVLSNVVPSMRWSDVPPSASSRIPVPVQASV